MKSDKKLQQSFQSAAWNFTFPWRTWGELWEGLVLLFLTTADLIASSAIVVCFRSFGLFRWLQLPWWFCCLIKDFLVRLSIEGWVATEHDIPGMQRPCRIEQQAVAEELIGNSEIYFPKVKARCMITPRLHMSAMWSYFPASTSQYLCVA